MKFIAALILTALLAYAAGLYGILPWWSFAITSFLVSMAIPQRPGTAFLSGFSGLFLLWVLLAWLKDTANAHLLSTKVAALLPLGGSYLALLLVTGVVGGLVSGLSALSGGFFRQSKKINPAQE